MKQHFWAGNEYLGSRDIPRIRLGDPDGAARGTRLPHFNTAYFCAHCGEIWGRITFEEAHPMWQVISRACRNHARLEIGRLFEGCLQSTFPGDDPCRFARDWPADAVKWEAETLLSRNVEEFLCQT
jgi:hypothetical protein